MKVMRSTSDIAKVYDEMLKRPCVQNELSILGTLHSTLRGLWKYEVVLDKWPDFTGLVLRPLQLDPRKALYQEVYLNGESETLHKMLASEDILPWDECLTFRASPTYMKSVLHEVARNHGGSLLDFTGNYIYNQFEDTILDLDIEMWIPEGFRVGPVEEQHLAYMQDLNEQHLKAGDSHLASLETQKILLKKTYSACMYKPDSKPVSWVLAHLTGEPIQGFTDPEYRGNHLFGLVLIYYSQQAHKFGQLYGHGLSKTKNKSMELAVKGQAKALPQLVRHFHYIPSDRVKSKI